LFYQSLSLLVFTHSLKMHFNQFWVANNLSFTIVSHGFNCKIDNLEIVDNFSLMIYFSVKINFVLFITNHFKFFRDINIFFFQPMNRWWRFLIFFLFKVWNILSLNIHFLVNSSINCKLWIFVIWFCEEWIHVYHHMPRHLLQFDNAP
jgi:hypothetical protein